QEILDGRGNPSGSSYVIPEHVLLLEGHDSPRVAKFLQPLLVGRRRKRKRGATNQRFQRAPGRDCCSGFSILVAGSAMLAESGLKLRTHVSGDGTCPPPLARRLLRHVEHLPKFCWPTEEMLGSFGEFAICLRNPDTTIRQGRVSDVVRVSVLVRLDIVLFSV